MVVIRLKASLLNNITRKSNGIYNLNGGLNGLSEPCKIGDNDLSDCINISNEYNKSSVQTRRLKKSALVTLTTKCNGLAYLNAKLHWVDGVNWYIGFRNKYTLTDADREGNFGQFSTGTTDYIIYANGKDRVAYDGSTETFTSITNAPLGKFFATNKGRLFWISGNSLIFSALNDIFTYDASSGGGKIIFEDSVYLRSIISYDNNIYVWDEKDMYVIYGTDSSTFEKVKINCGIGSSAMFSDSGYRAVICNSSLYWLSEDGLYRYNGGMPVKVSLPVLSFFRKINHYILDNDVTMCASTNRIYISFVTVGETYEYDIIENKWYKRSDVFEAMTTDNNSITAIEKTTLKLWYIPINELGQGYTGDETNFAWNFITKAFDNDCVSRGSNVSELWIKFSLPIGSTGKILYSPTMDKNDFVELQTFTASADVQKVRIIIPPNILNDNGFYRYKFEGVGTFTLYYLETKGRVKSR